MSETRRQDLLHPPGPETQRAQGKEGLRPEAAILPGTSRLFSRFCLVRHDEAAILQMLRQVPYFDRLHARISLFQALGGRYTNAGPRALALCERVFGPGTMYFPSEPRGAETHGSPPMGKASAVQAHVGAETMQRQTEPSHAAVTRGTSEAAPGVLQPAGLHLMGGGVGGDDRHEQKADAAAETAVQGTPREAPQDERADTVRSPSDGQDTAGVASVPFAVHRLFKTGGGRPLPDAVRARMEVHFGHRLSRVRVHDGSLADEATRSVGATAYTLGHDIVFSSGAFRPDTIEGLHLLAHELAHVIQQDGTPTEPSALLHLGPVDDPLEGEADRAADALMRNHALSPWQISAGRMQRRLQRAVSKVCNPPSAWFSLGGVPNLPAAVAFGAIAERFISTNIIATTATAPGNFYLDHPLAGPIDPFYVAFIIRKNPGLSAFQKAALALMTVARPDVLLHQAPIFQFEEVKPNSVAGRAAGR
ncbi:MAG TPA: DUF4157 domain-containing protein, partial [Polyangia bacterium]|nr:DUF4157 domain-containing protein [Polyangia bacterium]